MLLIIRFSRVPRVKQVGTLSIFAGRMSLVDQTERVSHGMVVACAPCKTTARIPFICSPAVLKHTCSGETCTVVV